MVKQLLLACVFITSCRSYPRTIDFELANFGDPPAGYHEPIRQFYTKQDAGETLTLFIGYPQKAWWNHKKQVVYGWEVPVEIFEFERWLRRDYHRFSHGSYCGIAGNESR